jgi:hypothetical protein
MYRKEDVLFQQKIRGASEKFKNQPRPLLRPRSVNFRQHFRNLSRKRVPLNQEYFTLVLFLKFWIMIRNQYGCAMHYFVRISVQEDCVAT